MITRSRTGVQLLQRGYRGNRRNTPAIPGTPLQEFSVHRGYNRIERRRIPLGVQPSIGYARSKTNRKQLRIGSPP
jgi:hypothetical protein